MTECQKSLTGVPQDLETQATDPRDGREFMLPLVAELGACSPSVSYVQAPVFFGELVCVPQVFCKDSGRFLPPPKWMRTREFVPQWFLPCGDADSIDPQTHNLGIVRSGKVSDFAWLVSGVRDVVVARWDGEVRELCHIAWKPCWIPLQLIDKDGLPSFQVSLKQAEHKYITLLKKRQEQLNRFIHPQILRFLCSFKTSPWQLFRVHRVSQYARVDLDGRKVDVVKAQFCDSYEHCSSLIASVDLWIQVNEKRVEAGQKLLKIAEEGEGHDTLVQYIDRALSDIKELRSKKSQK